MKLYFFLNYYMSGTKYKKNVSGYLGVLEKKIFENNILTWLSMGEPTIGLSEALP